jgi:hypothetical protein
MSKVALLLMMSMAKRMPLPLMSMAKKMLPLMKAMVKVGPQSPFAMDLTQENAPTDHGHGPEGGATKGNGQIPSLAMPRKRELTPY